MRSLAEEWPQLTVLATRLNPKRVEAIAKRRDAEAPAYRREEKPR